MYCADENICPWAVGEVGRDVDVITVRAVMVHGNIVGGVVSNLGD